MVRKNYPTQDGQGLVEYALILVLVVLVVVVALMLTGTSVADIFASLPFVGEREPEANSEMTPIEAIMADFLSRIQAYYDENGRWPRGWGDRAFEDLGLDPNDWEDAVEGIYWKPHGDSIGLGNKKGDDLQVYVKDLDGNTLKLYDNWNIWCTTGGSCYYHTIEPGNEVDISTLVVVEEKREKKRD